MRRTFLLLACLLLTSLQGWSEKVVYDSIYYEIDEINHEARVTYYAPILGGAANGLYYKGDIVIPEITFYKGEIYPVTGISYWAFHDCPDITSISIPSSVKEIRHFAFENCIGLTEISIPESVTEIWRGTFRGCEGLNKVEFASIEQMCSITYCPQVDQELQSQLRQYPNSNPLYMAKHLWIDGQEVTDLVIPEGITSIGNLAFAGGAFTSVTIPESVTSIGHSAFQGCKDLTSFTIPDGVTSIGENAFKDCTGLTSITIPGSVTSIGEYAFTGCTGLTSVIIPEGVTSIGYRAFEDCTGLTSVSIPGSLTSWGGMEFTGCTGLTSITFQDGVTSIGDAFRGCTSLTSVTFPESLTSIGESAFSGCTNLTSVTFPESLTSIGKYAFYNCMNLTSVTFPESLTSIGESAFSGCMGLTSITIPKNVTTVYGSTFSGCTNMESIVVENGNTVYDSRENCNAIIETATNTLLRACNSTVFPAGVTSIGASAFSGLADLTSFSIPESVTTIGSWAFSGCTGLTSITIPKSVTTIGSGAFSGCTGLTSVTIPKSVTTIGSGAFSGCTGLTAFIIPNKVTTVGEYAFRGCTNLASVTIPKSVTSIGQGVFLECAGLTTIISKMTQPASISADLNYIDSNNITLYIPKGRKDAYISQGWSIFPTIIEFTDKDVNRDDVSDLVDVVEIARFSAGTPSAEFFETVADINEDYAVDNADASALLENNVSLTVSRGRILTSFKPNTWYFMFQTRDYGSGDLWAPGSSPNSGGYLTDMGDGQTILKQSVNDVSNDSPFNDVASYLVRFIPTANEGGYYVQFGTGRYMSAPIGGGFKAVEDIQNAGEFNIYNIDASNPGYFGFNVYNMGARVDNNGVGQDVVTYQNGKHTSVNMRSNSIWSIVAAKVNVVGDDSSNAVGNAVTAFQSNRWYLMHQGREYGANPYEPVAPGEKPTSGGFLTDMGYEQAILKQSLNENIGVSTGLLNSLVRFIPTANEGGYYVQFGTGRYMSAPIGGGFKAVEDIQNAGEFNIYNIDASNPGYFGFNVYDMGARVDNNGVGGTVVTWQSGKHDVVFDADGKLASNSIWSIVGANINNVIGDISDGDSIQVADLNIGALATNLTIELNNTSDDLVAFQMDVTLPEGISLDPTGCTLSSRFADKEQRLNVTNSVGNTYRLTSASFALTPISGTDGALLDLSLTAYDGFVEGVAIISNVLFATSNSERVRMNDATCSIRNESYTLTYILDGETYKTFSIPLGGVITPEANPTKTGYTFSGWSEIPETMPNHDVTVTGSFSINSYTLTYLVDGEVYKSSSVVYGTALTPEADPEREDYTFSGWSEIPETMPDHDVTVTGSFAFTPAEYTLFDGTNYSLDCDAEVGTLHYSRTFKNTYWQAWYVPFDVTLTSELMAHFAFAKFAGTYTEEDGSFYITVVRLKEGDVVKANTPYCVQAKVADSSNPQIVTQTGATLKAAVVNSFYVLSAEKKITFFGNYTRRAVTEDDQNVYAMSGGKYSRQLSGNTLGSFRCFFTIEDREDNPYAITPNPAEVKLMVLGDDDGTGIAEVESEASGAEDEQGVVYDLSGRKLNGQNMRKGIYIVNGKKVFLK